MPDQIELHQLQELDDLTESNSSAPKRLPIVDGLRALAVTAVVLFHSWPSLLPGGFIGVDVFFVISGFIISLIYENKLKTREVTFRDFYIRRIRRLAPAYVVVVVLTTVASFALMLPSALVSYAWSLSFQAFYAQNIAFWSIGDYFDAPLTKPLLHTWSLAVEEQFYFVFPALIFLSRRKPVWRSSVLVASAAVSFLFGIVIVAISAKTPFYWLPMRAWEFIAGMLCASAYGRYRAGALVEKCTLDGGLILILASVILFGESSRFPGYQSIVAVAGTVMALYAQRAASLGAISLRTAIFQHVGRISYSWYLWHWPPLALWFLLSGSAATGVVSVALALFGLAGGMLSYQHVERATQRSRRLLTSGGAAAVLGGFAAFTLLCSAAIFTTDGFVRPYPARVQPLLRAQADIPPYRCGFIQRFALWREAVCSLGETSGRGGLLIIGDSHADRAKTVLVELANRLAVPVYLTKQNCRAIDYGAGRPECSEKELIAVKRSIDNLGIARIVLISNWPDALTQAESEKLGQMLAFLGKRTFVQLPTPRGPLFDPATYLHANAAIPYTVAETKESVEKRTVSFRSAIAHIFKQQPLVSEIDPVPLLCAPRCKVFDKGSYFYKDEHHLTLSGVTQLAPLYQEVFAGEASH